MINKKLYLCSEDDEGSRRCYLTYAKDVKEAAKKISLTHFLGVNESCIVEVVEDLTDENGVIDVFDYGTHSKCE